MKKIVCLIIVALSVICLFVSCGEYELTGIDSGKEQPQEKTPAIRGVLDIPEGAGVSGSDFFVIVYDGEKEVANGKGLDDGSFSVDGLEESRYYNVMLTTVNPSGSRGTSRGGSTGYGGWLNNVVASVNDQAGVGSVKVKPLGTIRGKVTLENSLEFYNVVIYIPGTSFDAHSAGTGEYVISNVPQGSYSLHFHLEGYVDEDITDVELFSDDPVTGPDKKLRDITMKISTGSVSGKISLPGLSNMGGVAVVLVNSETNVTYTGSTLYDGSFSLSMVIPGKYTLHVYNRGFSCEPVENVIVKASENTDIASLTMEELKDYGFIIGKIIVDGNESIDLSGISITAIGKGISASGITDNNGNFMIAAEIGIYTKIIAVKSCYSGEFNGSVGVAKNDESNPIPIMLYAHHNYDTLTLPAHCEEDGSVISKCSVCGKTEYEVIDATGHSFEESWTFDEITHWHAASCEHKDEKDKEALHDWKKKTVIKEPTCTEAGEMLLTCSVCGATKTEPIPATGHSFYSSWSSDSEYHWHAASCGHTEIKDKEEHDWKQESFKAATCTDSGRIGYRCSVCNETKTEIIPATGHTFSAEWFSDEFTHWHAATCDHTDVKGNESLHEWNEGIEKAPTCTEDGERISTCGVCGKTKTEVLSATGHSYYSAWSSDDDYHWHASSCGHDTIKDKDAHLWDSGMVKPASCTAAGSITYKCTVCNATKTEIIPATGHSYSEGWTYDAYYHWHAAMCEHTSLVSGKASHIWGNGVITKVATCSEPGIMTYTCSVCKEVKTELIPKTDHPFISSWSFDEFYHWHASTCEHHIIKDKAAHSWDSGRVTKAATCTDSGIMKYTCYSCGATKTESIPAKGHSFYSYWSYDDTNHWHAASCGHNDQVSDKSPHRWNDGDVIKAATYIETGEKKYICHDCGDTKVETIPATGTFLYSPSDFAKIAQHPENDYVLANDIDFRGSTYSSLYSPVANFTGHFDGNGYAIKNYTYSSSSTKTDVGFFRVNRGTIENVAFINCTFKDIAYSETSSSATLNIGIVCGTNYGTISKVFIDSCNLGQPGGRENYTRIGYYEGAGKNAQFKLNSGLVCGFNEAYSVIEKTGIVNSGNYGVAMASHTGTASCYVAGITARNNGDINNCYQYSNTLVARCVGRNTLFESDGGVYCIVAGLAIYNYDDGTIKNCLSYCPDVLNDDWYSVHIENSGSSNSRSAKTEGCYYNQGSLTEYYESQSLPGSFSRSIWTTSNNKASIINNWKYTK